MAEIDISLVNVDLNESHVEFDICFCDRCHILKQCLVINGKLSICRKCHEQISAVN